MRDTSEPSIARRLRLSRVNSPSCFFSFLIRAGTGSAFPAGMPRIRASTTSPRCDSPANFIDLIRAISCAICSLLALTVTGRRPQRTTSSIASRSSAAIICRRSWMPATRCWRVLNSAGSRPYSSARCSSSSLGSSDSWRVASIPPPREGAGVGDGTATEGATGVTRIGAGAPVSAPPPETIGDVAPPGSILISPLSRLSRVADIVKGVPKVVDQAVRPPQQQERHAEQATDEDIPPERLEPQPQPVHEQVAPQQADVLVAPRQPH